MKKHNRKVKTIDEMVEEMDKEIKDERAEKIDVEIAKIKSGAPEPSNLALIIKHPVSIIVTARNEALLPWTVDNIKRTTQGAEIIVIYDGWQNKQALPDDVITYTPWVTCQGVDQCRHFGISRASGDYIILLDAHMDFEDNWLDKMLEPCIKNERAISCSKSAVLYSNQLSIRKTATVHSGAYFKANHGLDLIWSDMTNEPYKSGDVIQCILGACYCFKKSRYFEILEPWKNNIGWGSSEQLISLVNWYLGGVNILADCVTGHVYRTNDESKEQRVKQVTTAGLFYNNLRLIDILPIPDDQKRELTAKVLKYQEVRQFEAQIKNWLDLRDDSKLKEALKQGAIANKRELRLSDVPKEIKPQIKPKQININRNIVIENRRKIIFNGRG